MQSLFQSFERYGVDYLLISGQASVLYGAATFSEDIDLWLRPERANAERLLRALASRRAQVYKLTPPLSVANLRYGHGFHFLVPGAPLPIYLDVMGAPPRVGSFAGARRRASVMATSWGEVPVVAITDLIAMKRTRRLSDYEIISNLVGIRVREAKAATPALLRWAVAQTFRAEDRVAYLERLGRRASVEVVRRRIAAEIARAQRRDVAYWSPRIADLRRLRRAGELLRQGANVADLL